jgi:hypothetical protein
VLVLVMSSTQAVTGGVLRAQRAQAEAAQRALITQVMTAQMPPEIQGCQADRGGQWGEEMVVTQGQEIITESQALIRAEQAAEQAAARQQDRGGQVLTGGS